MPVFPLPGVWLFPYFVLPLHVFEPRYRQLVEDCLDGPGRFVLGTIRGGHEQDAPGRPPIHELAGLGEIGRHERLSDGRFNILLVGVQRVFVREVASERLYRQVEIRPAEEVPIARRREPELRAALERALGRNGKSARVPGELGTGHLADMLLLRLGLAHELLNELYGELDVEARALRALAEHERRAGSSGATPADPDARPPRA